MCDCARCCRKGITILLQQPQHFLMCATIQHNYAGKIKWNENCGNNYEWQNGMYESFPPAKDNNNNSRQLINTPTKCQLIFGTQWLWYLRSAVGSRRCWWWLRWCLRLCCRLDCLCCRHLCEARGIYVVNTVMPLATNKKCTVLADKLILIFSFSQAYHVARCIVALCTERFVLKGSI